MARKSVIIIGAGLAGLSAGCYAQMNGYDARIFEHRQKPGGVVASWRRQDYVFDGGVHFWMSHDPRKGGAPVYDELGISQTVSFIEPDVYMHFTDERLSTDLTVTRDMERFRSELTKLSPEDADLINGLIDGALVMGSQDMMGGYFDKPPELLTFLDRLRLGWSMRRLVRYMRQPWTDSARDFMKEARSDRLKTVVETLFLPDVPVWFVMMVLGAFATGKLALLDGVSTDVVKAMEERFLSLGGEIEYGAQAEKILVDIDRAVGIQLRDGSEHRADFVISAADGHDTIFKMLGEELISPTLRDRYARWPLITPTLMINYGVAREYSEKPWLTAVRLAEPIDIGPDSTDLISVRLFNYTTKTAPTGKSVVQASLDTRWSWWRDLRADNDKYRTEKQRIADEVLRRLEPQFPGITEDCEVTDVATPYTVWRYTLNRHGAYMGWMPTPEALNARVERTIPDLHGFLMAGQWTVPGGGVLPCIYSGRQAVQVMCAKDWKSFRASVR